MGMPIYDKYLQTTREGDAGGGGLTPVIDSGSTAVTSLGVEGGKQYVYTRPLTELTVASVADTPQEAEIIFSAGAAVAVADSMTIQIDKWHEGHNEEWTEWYPETYGEPVTLVRSGGGFVADLDHYDWSECYHDWDMEGSKTVLENGSFVCVSSGGQWVLSAAFVEAHYSKPDNEWIKDSEVPKNGPIAVWNGSAWTSAGDFQVTCYWDYEGEIRADQGGFREATAPLALTPCRITLPADVRLIGSETLPEVREGSEYDMVFAGKRLAMAEVFEQAEEE